MIGPLKLPSFPRRGKRGGSVFLSKEGKRGGCSSILTIMPWQSQGTMKS